MTPSDWILCLGPEGQPEPPIDDPLPEGVPIIDEPGREVPVVDPQRRDVPEPRRDD